MGLGLDIEHAHDLGVPGQGNGQHRRDIAALVDAADPQEALVLRTSATIMASWLAATRPVTPSPNGTRARPIW